MMPGFLKLSLLVAASVLTAGVVQGEETKKLTLQEAMTLAVSNNLDVRAELYNPAMAEAEWRKNKGIYDPKLALRTDYTDSRTLSTGGFVSSDVVDEETFRANPEIKQLLPTGGILGLAFNNTWNRDNQTSFFESINNYWQSDLTLSFSQPLLKNFGRTATNVNITVAEYNKYGSFERFKTRLINVVAQVRDEYFKLYRLQEEVAAKRVSLEFATKFLDDTKGKVRAGVLPAVEILKAEFEAADREGVLLSSYRSLQDQMDILRLLLQLPQDVEIILVDQPDRSQQEINEEEAIKAGLESRPDILELKLQLKSNELVERVNANRTLPSLNLLASGGLNGLGETYGRDMDRVSSGDYPAWSVGLELEYPIGNRDARNEHIRSKLRVGQSRAQLESLEQTARKDIISAIRAVNVRFKQIEITERGRTYGEENLRAFVRKHEVGLATTKDVLDAEEDLAEAKSNHIAAVVDYTSALTQLHKVTGKLLEKEGISIAISDVERFCKEHK